MAFLLGFEGGDGSGKGTQFRRALTRARSEGKRVGELDFPRYGDPSARLVEMYLRGELGKDVDGYQGSILYAVDRFAAFREQINARPLIETFHDMDLWLTNRYVSSNMGHQAGKAPTPEERERIVQFIEYLEYDVLGLPRPDDIYLLDVHEVAAQRMVDLKEARSYIEKKRDLHEDDINHLRNARESYLEVAASQNWTVIDCMIPGSDPTGPIEECVRSKRDIHEEIYADITRRFL